MVRSTRNGTRSRACRECRRHAELSGIGCTFGSALTLIATTRRQCEGDSLMTSISTRVAAGLLAALTTLSLPACGSKSTIKPEGAAQSVIDVVAKRSGFRPTDVSCPSGVEAKVGQQFDC